MSLSSTEIDQTAAWIASSQLRNGMVPWYRGGHADPWNHVEATMALAAGGRWAEVERALEWLTSNQLEDGSWCTFYLSDGVIEPRRDPNVCAYIATGAWWCWQLSGDGGILAGTWPMLERAISWCLRYQLEGGEMAWSVGPDGAIGTFALLAATSSFQHSLRCGARVAEVLGHERQVETWSSAADRAAEAVAKRPGSFEPKHRWAMDWYYPVLSGAVVGQAAERRMLGRWDELVMDGLGARCVADRPWVTAAETAECAMAAARAGLRAEAEQLLAWTGHLRASDGAYWTGCVHPECVRFPGGQQSTYSAAAVLIADHVLNARSPAAAIFASSPPAASAADEAASPHAAGSPSTWTAASISAAALLPEAMHAGTPTPP
jgi:hypothetical protein